MTFRWVVVSALPLELRPTVKALRAVRTRCGSMRGYSAGPILFASVGVGAANAERGTEILCGYARPTDVISTGLAGALAPELRAGDLVVSGMDAFGVRAIAGQVVSADRVLVARVDKEALARSSGAVAVDMESAAVGRVARRHGADFACVKVILDTLDEPLACRYSGVGEVLAGLVRRPRAFFADLTRTFAGARRLAEFFASFAAAQNAGV